MAQILFTKFEKKQFNVLTSIDERRVFIKNFWKVRNPNPLSEDNEFKDEIYRRFDFVNHYFREGSRPGWKSDRGRIYLQFGEPDHIEMKSIMNDPSIHGFVYWYYGSYSYKGTGSQGDGFGVFFIDKEGHGRYMIDMERTSIRLLDATKKIKYLHIRDKDEGYSIKDIFFSIHYEREKENLKIFIDPKNIFFNSKLNKFITKLKINLIVQFDKKSAFKHSEVKKLIFNKEELLKKNFKILINIPLKIEGRNPSLDIFVSDLLGDVGSRKFIKKLY